MKKRDLLMLGLVMALSLPLNVWAATTLGDNLSVGDGTPDLTLDGEDAYIEGTLEVDGVSRFDEDVTFASTDAGTIGPILVFDHDKASPAVFDTVGTVVFRGNDSLGNDTDYAAIGSTIRVETDGTESGLYGVQLTNGGTLYSAMFLGDDGTDVFMGLGDTQGLGGTQNGRIFTNNGDLTLSTESSGNVILSPENSNAIVADGAYATPYDSVTGPGAISLDKRVTTIATTGVDAYTLADGVEDGQRIEVACVNHVGDGTLTPTTALGFTSVTFDGAGQSVSLMWFEGAGWAVVDTYGVTVNP